MATPMPPACEPLTPATGDERQPVSAAVVSCIVLVASLYTTMTGTAHAGRPTCHAGLFPAFIVVHDQAWTECDCVRAKTAATFRRCYRAGVRRLGTNQGLPEECIRELMTQEFVRSTCGRPKAVVCCTQRKIYGYRPQYCAVKPSAKRCVAPRSGKACINVGQQECFHGIGAASNCGCIEQ